MTYAEWLNDPGALRCILVEAAASVDGVETTHYLSTRGYTTGAADSPANTVYIPLIAGGVQLTEEISLDGGSGLSYGDIELFNFNGDLDAWLDYIWVNRVIRVYIGDLHWLRAGFQLIFDGIIDNLDSKSRDRLNLKIRDKLQRLNTPASEAKLGGLTTNADALIPLTFGEVSNITPLLSDPATHEYQVHDGAIEAIIEVRDNGVPVAVTPNLAAGKFNLLASPAGTITASVQGDKPAGVYSNTIAALVQRLATGYGKASTRFVAGDLDSANLADFEDTHPQPAGVYLSSRENVITTLQELAASVGAHATITRAGKLALLQIDLPPHDAATVVTVDDMVVDSLHIAARIEVKAAVKVGYCKNWSEQPDLQSGIPEEHKELFADQMLTISQANDWVADAYKLDAEPEQRNTLLLDTEDATAETERELFLYSTPRTIIGFEGFSNLFLLELGQAVTLVHPRFGLATGKTGVVVKLQPDWINFRVQVEVLGFDELV